MIKEKPTKSDSTKRAYIERAKSMVANFEAATGEKMMANDPRFISFFLEKTKNKSQSNWRQLKASLIYYFDITSQGNLVASIESMDVNHIDTTKKSILNLTSSKKKKSITEAERTKLTKYLIASGGSSSAPTYDKALVCMFNASIATGLRPIEWSTAEILSESPAEEGINLEPPILKVKNAKATNGRSYGEYRYLGLSSLSEININFVRLALSLSSKPVDNKGNPTTYSRFYESCRRRFYDVVNHVFKNPRDNRITLYTARHQFIANLKAAGYPLEEIACLVGHGNDLTASKHYGKRRSGNKQATGFPIANKADISKVRAKYHQFAQESANSIQKKDN